MYPTSVFLPRCQSANAAVNLGMERPDLDNNFTNSIQSSLSGSINIVQTNSQDKTDPNQKPREKSKLRDVRVNSAHSKIEKTEKKSKNETPRSTPEPKMFFSRPERHRRPSEDRDLGTDKRDQQCVRDEQTRHEDQRGSQETRFF
ncbi:unnamed protein product [Danaus chrysippus]|uniref:(African queen) hypothetical protein n=1 Tax=Danaus chrysippus TaxID=151541 RepID=A0A8J2QKS7_9NEOP|nr:unnamed protein product [Danaus chrysippus]